MRWRSRNDWDPQDVIAHQRAMNAQTWATLQEHGVTEGTDLRLDFTFQAPNKHAAEELAAYLRQETDYDVSASKNAVTGSTQPTTVSPSVLDEWVGWMVAAGYEKGRCRFDGWGAAVP